MEDEDNMAKKSKKQDDMLPTIPSTRKNVQDATLKNVRVSRKLIQDLEARVTRIEHYLETTTRGQATDFRRIINGKK